MDRIAVPEDQIHAGAKAYLEEIRKRDEATVIDSVIGSTEQDDPLYYARVDRRYLLNLVRDI